MANTLSSNPSGDSREALVLHTAKEMLLEKGLSVEKLDVFLDNNNLQQELLSRIAKGGASIEMSDIIKALRNEQERVRANVEHQKTFTNEAVPKVAAAQKSPGLLSRWYIKWPLIIGGLGVAAYFGWGWMKELLEKWNKDLADQALQKRTKIQEAPPALGGAPVIDDYTRQTTTGTTGGGSANRTNTVPGLAPGVQRQLKDQVNRQIDGGTFAFPTGPNN